MELRSPRGKSEGEGKAPRLDAALPSPAARRWRRHRAIVVFALIGKLSHHGGVTVAASRATCSRSSAAGSRVALVVRLYTPAGRSAARRDVARRHHRRRGVRAAILGHTNVGKEAAFLAVALVFTAVFALAARLAASWASAQKVA